ncbi:MAG: PAS domain S-box protein, partial [bacterium]
MDKKKNMGDDATQSLRVLIVEDSPRDAELVLREIRRGFPDLIWKRVETAEEMRTALGAESWNLVMSDFSLPHFDGFAALATLQETGLDLPFIIVSGTIGEETAVAAMRAGAHDYLMKDKLARLQPVIARELDDAQVRMHERTAELDLRTSETRYRRLFESARDGILILDAETGMVMDVNPYLVELLGVTREVFLGKRIWELGFFKDLVNNEANFLELQAKQHIRYEDMALEGYDGKRHEVEFVSTVYLVDNQKVIQCNIRDNTERNRAQAELRASQHLIEGILNAIPVRVFWKDRNLVYLGCNTIFAQDAGFSRPDEVIGKTDYQMFWHDHAMHYRDDDRNVIESKCPKLLYEEEQNTPDGNEITLLTSKVPLYDLKGNISGILGTYMDI